MFDLLRGHLADNELKSTSNVPEIADAEHDYKRLPARGAFDSR
jgi:hypothetical protein